MTITYEIGKPRQDGRMRVTILVCVGNTKKRIKTNLLCTKTDINKKGKLIKGSPIYEQIREISYKYEKEFAKLDTYLSGQKLTAADAVSMIGKKNIPTFFEYADIWLSKATMKSKHLYAMAVRNFRKFTKDDIPFSLFSHSLLDDYARSLQDTKRAQSLYMTCIKRIYTDAELDYDITPFAMFKFKVPTKKRSPHKALDLEIIRRVFAYDGKGYRKCLARDCCMLSFCTCGTNATDLYHAPTIKGNILAYDRMKTKDRRFDNAHIEIDILPQIADIVKRYKGTSKAFSFSSSYKTIESFETALFNGLNQLIRELGLPHFTFYAFRHSWATIARNELRIEKSLVHAALNHIEKETAIDDVYIKPDYRLINEANKKVVDYVLPLQD